jgi:hypothetical protein
MKAGFIAVKLYLGINSFWLLKVATPICFALEVQTYRGRLVWRGWNAQAQGAIPLVVDIKITVGFRTKLLAQKVAKIMSPAFGGHSNYGLHPNRLTPGTNAASY